VSRPECMRISPISVIESKTWRTAANATTRKRVATGSCYRVTSKMAPISSAAILSFVT
jgi:hypothetical protein